MTINGETDLEGLLANPLPQLHDRPYIFCSVEEDTFQELPFTPLCAFYEQEGVTLVALESDAQEINLSYDQTWARITLMVHSSLSAVGFLAAVTTKLAREGLSVNPISAYYHDHLFVHWEARSRAMELLQDLGEVK
jgi:hypothetical protein